MTAMKLSLHYITHDAWTPVLSTTRIPGHVPVHHWNAHKTDLQTAHAKGWIETRNITVKPGVVHTEARFTELVERRA